MLWPATIAVVLILIASGYLVFTGFYGRENASVVRQVSIPAVTALKSIQQERQLTIVYLTQRSKGSSSEALLKQRQVTDQHVDSLKTVAQASLSLAPQSIVSDWGTVRGYLDRLPEIRSAVDNGSANSADVYNFYDSMLSSAGALFNAQARTAPDPTSSQGGLDAVAMFQITDSMSRAGSLVTGAFGDRKLSTADFLQFSTLVGYYQAQITTLTPNLVPDVRKKAETLVQSDEWKQLTAAEGAVIASGPWHSEVPSSLPITASSWSSLTNDVFNQLINLTIEQADEASGQALDSGNSQLAIASSASLLALLLAVGAILWAIRRSQLLVDSALVVRLRRLGESASDAVERQLPRMLERIRAGDKVDVQIDLVHDTDDSYEEVRQMAEVVNGAVSQAADAAVREAEGRVAATQMLVGIARRSQHAITTGIHTVRSLQKRVGNDDPEMLEHLLGLDHALTRNQRESENLVILGGGQIYRRFEKPVPLGAVVQNAMAETQQFQRIRLRQAPADVALAQHAVGPVTHLLAELLDNALRYSQPTTAVEVECTRVEHGYVVEIEDRGLGMSEEDMNHYNQILNEDRGPDLAALKQAAQWGFWVVTSLAQRYGVRVALRTSPWGGTHVIVLIPRQHIVAIEDSQALPAPTSAVPASAAPSNGAHSTGNTRRYPHAVPTPPAPRPAPTAPAMNGRGPAGGSTGQSLFDSPRWPQSLQQGGGMGNQRSDNTDGPPSRPSPRQEVPQGALPRLPDRVRGASLAAPLRGDESAENSMAAPRSQEHGVPRTPEEQMSRYSSLQHGLHDRRGPRPYPHSDNETDA